MLDAGEVNHPIGDLRDFSRVLWEVSDDIRGRDRGGGASGTGGASECPERRRDRQRRSRSPTEDSAQLPTLDQPLDETGCVTEERPARSEGQLVCAIGRERVRAMVSQQSFIR